MRYRLVSGSVWGRGGDLPLGSIVDIDDETAAVWRAGNCVIEAVESAEVPEPVAAAPEVEPQPSPKPRRNSRKRAPSPEGA